jgi:gliding motility-associated-like protein
VKSVGAQAQGSSIVITWSASSCNPQQNKLTGYRIYRMKGCAILANDPCKTGITDTSKFKLIGTVQASSTRFTDNNNGDGLVVGQNYSYIVVAEYEDGLQSFGSAQVCAQLKRDVPVITNVDVLSTGDSGGVDIKWLRPLTGGDNLDLTIFKGPYRFVLKHRANVSDNYTPVYTTSKTTFTDLEEAFTHTLINTIKTAHEYVIDFYSDTTLVGSSQKASSEFLVASPNDRKIDLKWSAKTPWDNYNYVIYRQDPATTTFVTIGSTSLSTYSDNKNVENGKTYCYYIVSEGAYSDPSLPKPLINRSQRACATAVDLTPPVTPTVSINADCPNNAVEVSWTDILKQSDDVDVYELYYKPSVTDTYERVAVVKSNQQLLFRNDNSNSFAGCYAVKAIDINKNIGALSPDFCIDNCPEFELPNVFTPNGDGVNDFFKAVKVRQIKEIDLSVTDRWGNLVYHTTNPYFQWDGISQMNKQPLSEGTFFFVCNVFEPRLQGVITRTLHGYVELVR